MDSPVSRQDRSGARANVGRLAVFLAVLAFIGAAGWQVGRIVQPPLPASVVASMHDGQGHEQAHDQGQGQGQPHAHHHHHGGGVQLWATQTPALGIIALDGAGRILYRSDADGNNPPVSRCTGECAQRWEPLTLPDEQEPDLLGIKPEHFGTLRRGDGSLQVTLAGWPLYTVAGDTGSHDGLGAHGAEGTWFAVTPTGEKATP